MFPITDSWLHVIKKSSHVCIFFFQNLFFNDFGQQSDCCFSFFTPYQSREYTLYQMIHPIDSNFHVCPKHLFGLKRAYLIGKCTAECGRVQNKVKSLASCRFLYTHLLLTSSLLITFEFFQIFVFYLLAQFTSSIYSSAWSPDLTISSSHYSHDIVAFKQIVIHLVHGSIYWKFYNTQSWLFGIDNTLFYLFQFKIQIMLEDPSHQATLMLINKECNGGSPNQECPVDTMQNTY